MSLKAFAVASFLALASAGPCKPRSTSTAVTPSSTGGPASTTVPTPAAPTLPSTGAADLPPPVAEWKLLKIAAGHGLQNYTCASETANATANGALAVLYDVTNMYPGTAGTGLDQAAWDALPTSILWTQDIPLNLVNPAAADPGSPNQPNVLPEASYGADVNNPFPAPANLELDGLTVPFLGHHYFDVNGRPTFDLVTESLLASVTKVGDVVAPSGADKGILNTGAVNWLYLPDNGLGIGKGIKAVYRVVTAGGKAQPCSVSGAGSGSVPYTTFYWFFG